MTRYTWPHTPMDVGTPWPWAVNLPGDGRIGEVLVWAKDKTSTVTPAHATYRWPCASPGFPLVDQYGSAHELTGVTSPSGGGGTMGFLQPSMRSDGIGNAVHVGAGHDMLGLWTPTMTRVGTDYTIAFLAQQLATAGVPDLAVNLANMMGIGLGGSSTSPAPCQFVLWNGTGYTLAYSDNGALVTAASVFFAFRVSAGGNWTSWWGNHKNTGTFGGWTPPSIWQVRVQINDVNSWKIQEINVWEGAASDADVEGLRHELTGV